MTAMTDRQFKIILEMVRMILDGCENLDDAKQKVQQLIEEKQEKEEEE